MKGLCLWLTVGFVLFSFSGGFAKEEILPADLANLPPDVIKHDTYDPVSNPLGKTLKDSTDYWVGVLFKVPPDTGFTIGGAEFKVNNELINIKDTAYLYLTKNKIVSFSPHPDFDNVIQIDTVVAPFNRLQGKPFSPFEFVSGELFWIVLGPIPGGLDTNSAGQGWWAFSDTLPADTLYNYVSFGDSNSWKRVKAPLDMGNFVIRARGTFSPLDVIINEVMFNADPSSTDSTINHEWVELYNKGGIQTVGSQWKLYNEANGSVTLPSTPFPSGSYLVVHINDPEHPQDTGIGGGSRIDVYRSFPGEFFSNRQGGCALVKGSSALSVISWNLRNLAKNEFAANDTSSVPSFLNWESSFFAAKHLPLELFRVGRLQPLGGIGPLLTATSGISIGRNSLSSDSAFTLGSQWKAVTFMGGPNSAGSTMGAQNVLPMDFDTLVTDTVNQTSSWMIMLYIAGDYGDNLRSPDRWYFDVLNQIEKALPAAPRDVNVAVLYDTRRGRVGESNISQLTGATFRGTLKQDTFSDQVHNLTLTTPSVNTGDSSVLTGFVKWAKESLPSADHYVLALKGDGAGWEGICGDSGSVDRLEMGELKSAFKQAGLDTAKLDLLIFDAPLMSQLEVAAQVKGFAHRMVASPEMTGPADFDYPRLVAALNGAADTSTLVNTLKNILGNRTGKDPFAVWTTINLDNLDTVLRLVDRLAIDLKAGVEDPCQRVDSSDNYQLKIRNALRGFSTADHYGTQAQGMADFIDLRRFAALVNSSISEVGCTGHKLRADSVIEILAKGGPVISGLAGGGLDPNIIGIHRQSTAGGLSIYFPSARRRAIPIVGKTFPMYNNRSDHPFDSAGLESEGGVSQGHRIYALDALTCYPHAAGTCSGGVAPNQPYPPVDGFSFVQNYHWDEFLIRYYKPVADVDATFLRTTLNQQFSLNARGTSDPDSDPLIYFWDLNSDADSDFPCDSFEREDVDKNCDDDNTDDGDVKGGSSINLVNGLSTPGDNILRLYVWDDNHLNSVAPRFQASRSRDSFVVQIEFRGVQVAYEDLGVLGEYTHALDSIKPFIQDRKFIDLANQIGARTTMDPDEFTKDAGDKPHIIWSTGTQFSTTFPESCRIALNNALNNDSQGVWISGPRIGNDTEAKVYLESLFKDTINASLQPVDSLFPDTTFGHHFLSDIGPLPLISNTSLQSIVGTSVKCPTFPLLVTRSGKVVAVAKVISPGRGMIFSTFGLEHLANTAGKERLMRLVLDWLTVPQASASCGCPYAKGDFNGIGGYTSADVVSMLNCVYLLPGNCDLCFADVNCNGTLTSADAVLELNKVYLSQNTPPWCGP